MPKIHQQDIELLTAIHSLSSATVDEVNGNVDKHTTGTKVETLSTNSCMMQLFVTIFQDKILHYNLERSWYLGKIRPI